MTIDNNLLWVLIGTAGLSLLSLVYVWVDEGIKRRRYERQKQEEAAQAAAAPEPTAPEPKAELEPSASLQEAEVAPNTPNAPAATSEPLADTAARTEETPEATP